MVNFIDAFFINEYKRKVQRRCKLQVGGREKFVLDLEEERKVILEERNVKIMYRM